MYLLPLLFTLILSSFFCSVLILLNKKWQKLKIKLKEKFTKKNKYENHLLFFKKISIFFQDKRIEKRHIHQNKKIARWGGIAIFFSFIISICYNQNLEIDFRTFLMLVGLVFIFSLGLVDDIFELNWKIQFFFQIAIICFIVFLGIKIEFITNPFGGVFFLNYFFSFFITFFWILIIVNAINWSDGVDGLAGGIIFIASLTLFFLSLRQDVNQPPLAIISIILAGSILGFLLFNFPPAKIFMGSSGSFSLGYFVAILGIFAGAKIGATLLVLAVPLVDAIFVIWQRWKNQQSFFQADMRHLHHHLLKMGWSSKKIAFFYYLITLIGAFSAVFTQSESKLFILIVFSISIFVFCFSLNWFLEKENM